MHQSTKFGVATSKIRNVEGSQVYNLLPSGTCTLHCSATANTMARYHQHHGCRQSSKFEPCVISVITCRLGKIEKFKLHARDLHVQYAPQVSPLYNVVMPLS